MSARMEIETKMSRDEDEGRVRMRVMGEYNRVNIIIESTLLS